MFSIDDLPSDRGTLVQFAESATRLSGMDWLILCMGINLVPVADWAPELTQNAVDACDFARATDHIERLTGTPPRGAREYLMAILSDFRNQA